jgi:hypothetical protein
MYLYVQVYITLKFKFSENYGIDLFVSPLNLHHEFKQFYSAGRVKR